MYKLECMLDMLKDSAKEQFDKGIEHIDTHEMGEVVDMIKDLSKSLYYLEIYHGMKGEYHMTPEMYRQHEPEYYRDMDKHYGLRYYTEMDEHNEHEGKAGQHYMELMTYISDNHAGTPEEKQTIRTHVDKYMNATWEDLQKLIEHLAPEERTVIKAKMTTMLSRM